MRDQTEFRLAKRPFFVGDLLLVGTAGLVYLTGKRPLGTWQIGLIVLCVAGGAFLAILPYVLEFRLVAKLAEARELTNVVAQIGNLDRVAQQMASATDRWQHIQDGADRVAVTAKGIAERMSAEAKAFTEFMEKANDSEKATLRLEVDKLRRSEADWVHVVVRMLDHVYALHTGAVRSGQANLIAQLDQFQHACRDAARRIGLTQFTPKPSEPFDAQRHKPFEGQDAPAQGAKVAETIATGYTFQGRLLRPALVRLQGSNGDSDRPASARQPTDQSQVPSEGQKPAP